MDCIIAYGELHQPGREKALDGLLHDSESHQGNPQKEESLCPKDKFQLRTLETEEVIILVSGQFVPLVNH